MALVDYSDSEDESPQQSTPNPVPKASAAPTSTTSNFAVDKSNPRKIRVNLHEKLASGAANEEHEDAPAAKRPRVGASAFSDFNAMLPAPKREAQNAAAQSAGSKAPVRKVFSLKTGAEPGFSREADAELRHFFAEQDTNKSVVENATEADASTIPTPFPKPVDQPVKGNTFMFKPLSVARNPNKKKKSTSNTINTIPSPAPTPASGSAEPQGAVPTPPEPPKKKVNLFASSVEEPTAQHDTIDHDFAEEDAINDAAFSQAVPTDTFPPSISQSSSTEAGPQSLDTIASDLGLSAAARRQLFGRGGKPSGTAMNVVNFNTDAEYAANEEFRNSGEQVQHNPVRAIASGKHSLKSLVSSATGQKEALEESFATGRRNKKEAGNKYGW